MWGTLLTYGVKAQDRPELFEQDSLTWNPAGFNLNEQHNRQAPIARIIPYAEGNKILVNQAVPNTQRGRDSIENIKSGVFTGMSVEFAATREEYRGNLRIIKKGYLGGAGLVDVPSYGDSLVEAREKLLLPENIIIMGAYAWL